ncbi:Angiopoietin-related protein 1,Ficolin-1-A,Angiopoietin-1,Fibrinogen C domain-containing protein 1,Ryncolin-1,Tenascin-N,Angiopoietin-related protein 7,Angiopoietin-related protein 6,Ficolin-3,Fibrinogen C domain-containing protein 1-B,Fibroleukin,Fibrinogen-like protein 1,Ficolin-1,Ficolin-1-B,Angiopoietin-4,Tenascin-R,Ryncolin-2,Techylectin-5B,Fibrinogen C domain-containing protein 1-A,Microfibril-associated glycoprotein 4,Fibrinogen-like protein A,Ryncolin-3,Fibrinogen gamma chain,Angiopoietin-2,Ficolin|uniref:Fibrinogen C-terminal domain-containing protein n=1 Tax=Mytilus edulis TaxID=6550 RepID=A0A8S3PST0_MYTED|nr:Angiopoietin-related protein 1,Ficolin-1-A,Angiopoietin-1,Fibrinogen C domain-containing protein 1,Ryncolin-1,Tenascin-N,Angiopoietin-related protein 7,Angiopoietin-related protein 6,Ficolin-3,Fibrinogen C domain-containing protein 1-B,Fibroleukin,Fibrinogen-like protein 1,Ficolin-1,Ficolin-1-B,Angiopoietin-4,Tenascin-R,Ryncolin-2,Techylectin-5B,Fibrinogen C domain-containing protein 1-A,Microfibril-associated glycoprotein 4,Fibrinogen-like protein A,Ryncolin-3,Fibrinogen gamma chain,Angiopoieti
MPSLRGPLFVILIVLYVLVPGIETNNFRCYCLWDTRAWYRGCNYCKTQNRGKTSKLRELSNEVEQLKAELDRQKNITATSEAELLKRISTSITEQNSLWLKCITVTPGRDCDITQGCATKDRTCRPINVFQRRLNGKVSFKRGWSDYKDGFGTLKSEHWLGNEKLHNLTSQGSYELLITMEDFSNENRYAKYTDFNIGDEKTRFKMTFVTYTGDAGDSLAHHNGRKFSTEDQDNDDHSGSCAKWHKGGWWYGSCHTANLNGLYLAGGDSASTVNINWKAWKGYNYSLKATTMMIRRK